MGFISQEKFVEKCLDPDATDFREQLKYGINIYTAEQRAARSWTQFTPEQIAAGDAFPNIRVNREAAIAMYETAKQLVMNKGSFYGKTLRPWEIVPINLDRSKVWWGFEFETGYKTSADLSEVISYVWDNFDGVAFDGEGEGNYFSEITFTPDYADSYKDESSDACKFMKYLGDNNALVNYTGYSSVGTHFNLSVPWASTYDQNNAIAFILNNTLHMIPGGRKELFGRSHIYAGCFGQGSYVECKLFRTTYNYEQFQGYLKACNALSMIAVAVETIYGNSNTYQVYCSNFQALIDGTTDVPEFGDNIRLSGSADDTYVSGNEYSYNGDDDYCGENYYDEEEEEEPCNCYECRCAREEY